MAIVATLEKRMQALERLPKVPRVLPRGAKRPSPATLDRGAVSLGGRLTSLGEVVQVRLALLGAAGRRRQVDVLVTPDGARLLRRPKSKPAVVFVLPDADWVDIASARIPPGMKYLTGRMRVVGDCRLARRIYQTLTGDTSGRIV
jgi:hypothetical protein